MRGPWLALLLAGAVAVPAAEGQAPPPRPFLASGLQALADYGLSPLRLDREGWHALGALGLSAAMVHQADVHLQARLAGPAARQAWLDASMPWVSELSEGWVLGLAAATGWGLGDRRLADTSAQALHAMAIAAVYNQGLKFALWSNRPSQDSTAHRYFAYDQPSRGMPSGHTFAAFAMAESYGAEYGRWVTYPLALLVAYSRVYNNAHWASDVYVGGLMGVAAGWQVRQAALTRGQPRWRAQWLPNGDGGRLALSRGF